ncbi:MAG: ABC transporter ATP-binding protein [Bacteriovoracia bacterium]
MYNFVVKDPHFLPHCGSEIEIPLEKGDLITLVGENGVGKTTLLNRFYQQSPSLITLVEQRPLDFFYDRTLHKIRGIFLQSREAEISAEVFTKCWQAFHFHEKELRLQSSLSGGESQALKLCLGLSVERELYFLDEPSQFLDGKAKESLNSILQELIENQKSVVMIEHDLKWLKVPSTVHELVVEDGKLQRSKSWTI